MNRRGFISMLVGVAGATLVPWRGLVEPLISLPPRQKLFVWPNGTYWAEGLNFTNRLSSSLVLTQESLEDLLSRIKQYTHKVVICPSQLVVSPQVKHLIETDPVMRLAARLAGANV